MRGILQDHGITYFERNQKMKTMRMMIVAMVILMVVALEEVNSQTVGAKAGDLKAMHSAPRDSRVEESEAEESDLAWLIGRWEMEEDGGDRLGIVIEEDGVCYLTEEDEQSWDGSWRVEDDRVVIEAEGETVVIWLPSQERLLVTEGGHDTLMVFDKAD